MTLNRVHIADCGRMALPEGYLEMGNRWVHKQVVRKARNPSGAVFSVDFLSLLFQCDLYYSSKVLPAKPGGWSKHQTHFKAKC